MMDPKRFAAAFLAWSISYSLQLRKERLARRKGREDIVKRKDELIDKIVDLETRKEAGRLEKRVGRMGEVDAVVATRQRARQERRQERAHAGRAGEPAAGSYVHRQAHERIRVRRRLGPGRLKAP